MKQLLLLMALQALMPKVVALWEELHLPLIHRSLFLATHKGKETFYYEVSLQWP